MAEGKGVFYRAAGFDVCYDFSQLSGVQQGTLCRPCVCQLPQQLHRDLHTLPWHKIGVFGVQTHAFNYPNSHLSFHNLPAMGLWLAIAADGSEQCKNEAQLGRGISVN